MQYRLIAFDIDGTLTNSSGEISDETVNAISRVRERGIKITLATGRSINHVGPYAEKLGLCNVPLITCNGALISNYDKTGVLYHRPLTREQAMKVLETARKYRMYVQIYMEDTVYYERGWLLRRFLGLFQRFGGIGSLKRLIYYFRNRAWTPVDDITAFVKESPVPPDKIFTMGPKRAIENFAVEMRESPDIELTSAYPESWEINHRLATKGEALKVVAAHYGVSLEEVAAIGDSLNDISMINAAGLGAAMGNARPELKAVADFITRTNDEEGVAYLINEIILNGRPFEKQSGSGLNG